MSAETLRKAANVLRERAEAATKPDAMHPWGDRNLPALPPEAHSVEVKGYLGGPWGDYYATMHPGVGLALAAALDHAADHFYSYNAPHLDAVADLILGGAE